MNFLIQEILSQIYPHTYNEKYLFLEPNLLKHEHRT